MGAGPFSNEISQIANAHFNGRSDLKLLKAGCGSATHFKIAGIVKSVGIDISQQQLDRNPVIQEKILGDIQTHPLPADEFDVIICWDVLEHLPRPQEALANMCKAVRPGGLILMGFPHAASFKGIVTKSTRTGSTACSTVIFSNTSLPLFQRLCAWRFSLRESLISQKAAAVPSSISSLPRGASRRSSSSGFGGRDCFLR